MILPVLIRRIRRPFVDSDYFMTKSGLPKSVRKFIRREKNRIRREVFDLAGQKHRIEELYIKLSSTKAQKH